MSATFRSLRNRNYRLYAAGSLSSNVGTWLQRVAQDWLVLQLSGSGTAVGITTGLQFLPFLLLAPWAGLIADRFPKRKVLQITQAGMGVTAAMLAVLSLTGVAQVWHVYVLSFVLGVFSAIDNPARQSFVIEMVGKDDVTNAVGLNSASFNAARIVGPAVAGFMLIVFDPGVVIAINAVTYLGPIWALSRMRASELSTPEPAPRKKGMVRDGLRYVRGRPDLLLILAVVFFVGCFGLNFQLTSLLMATEVFGKGSGEYGILGSIMAIGSLAGALLAARRLGRPRQRMIIGAAVLFGLVEIVSGVMPTYLLFAITLPIVGIASMTMITSANATMQLSVTPEMRGRVMALYAMVFIGSTPLGAPIVGWVAEEFGARWTLIGGGAMSVLGTLVAAWLVKHRQGLRVRAHMLPRPHVHVFEPEDGEPTPPNGAVPTPRGPEAAPDPTPQALSVEPGKVRPWSSTGTSRPSRSTPTASRPWREKGLLPRFRRARTGRSATL